MKEKWKLNIKRVDVERMLILCASALVVVLALQGGGEAAVASAVDLRIFF